MKTKYEKNTVSKYPNWRKIHLNGRTILRSDERYFSAQQMQALYSLEVLEERDGGKTLIVENSDRM